LPDSGQHPATVLRRIQRESVPLPFVFVSERGTPFTTAGFARMIERAAVGAGLESKAHHMLRQWKVATPRLGCSEGGAWLVFFVW
jgi:hypothetical protein